MTGFRTTTFITVATLGATCALAGGGASSGKRSVSLTRRLLVMRLHKDEFRIALDSTAVGCEASGLQRGDPLPGALEDRGWRGDLRVQAGQLQRAVAQREDDHRGPPVFDTAEGIQTIEVVKLAVEHITLYRRLCCNHAATEHGQSVTRRT